MKSPDLRAGLWRVLCCMLLLALLLIASIAPVHAAPAQITGTFVGTDVGRDVTYTFAGKVQTHWAGSLLFDVDNGPRVHVFCIQIQVAVRTGDRYRSDGSVTALNPPNGCHILYLLDKYPASTATTPGEAAARQLAIWVFSDGLDPATITDPAVHNRTIVLVNEAKAGQCPTQRIDAPNLTLTPPNASAVVGQTVKYTVQAGPKDAGATANVTVTGPATLANGQQQGSLVLDAQGAAPLEVGINGVGNVEVHVALPYRLSAGIVLSQLDPNVKTQRLVDAGNLDRVATAVAHVSVAAVITPTAAQAPPPSPTPPPPPPPPPPTRRPSKPKPTQTPEARAHRRAAHADRRAGRSIPPPPRLRLSQPAHNPSPHRPAARRSRCSSRTPAIAPIQHPVSCWVSWLCCSRAAGDCGVREDKTLVSDGLAIRRSNVTLDLTTPGLHSGVDIALARGARISGKVTSLNTGAALKAVVVAVRVPASGQIVGVGLTDASGNYLTSGLPSGTYRVEFVPDHSPVIETATYQRATIENVVVSGTNVVTGVDAQLVRDPRKVVLLPLIQRT